MPHQANHSVHRLLRILQCHLASGIPSCSRKGCNGGRHGGRGGGVEHRDSQSSMSSAPYSSWLGAVADGIVCEGVGSEEVVGMCKV